MTKDWVHGVGHSPVCQILLQIVVRAMITSSPPAWTISTGMLSTPADFHFFTDCTVASDFFRRRGGLPLCLSEDNSVLMDLHWPCSCTAYSSTLSIGSVSVASWTVVAFPCFTVVKSFTSWYALLLLLFFRFSSISLHCSPIQFSLVFCMHLLMLFTSLYFSDPSGSNLFFLSSLVLLHRSRISAAIQGFFF